MIKISVKLFILVILFVATFCGCKKEDLSGQAPEDIKKVNRFIKDGMTTYYLWNKQMPHIDYRFEFNSKEYFNKLLYQIDDWSFITDDVQSLENSLEGKEVSFGWSLAFGQLNGIDNTIAIIEFVYPDSPADLAGFKRGDLIYKINGADITLANYKDLLFATNVTCTYGQYNLTSHNIVNSKTAQMNSMELDLDPVLFSEIIETDGHKIGYFFYAQYIDEYTFSLDTVFQQFITEGVTDVVIDLRYNPGGRVYSAQYLSSIIAPTAHVGNNDILVRLQWNNDLQEYLEQNAIMHKLEARMINTVPIKMGLDKIYFLTGEGTASASELTIIGLDPYMEVITIGDTTYGKYTASNTFKPEDIYNDKDYYEAINNWGIQPIIARYINTLGFTDFINGLYPTIPVYDEIEAGIPLGNIEEPLLKAAIENITGSEIIAQKSSSIRQFQIFDRGFSRFDPNKREVILDQFNQKNK